MSLDKYHYYQNSVQCVEAEIDFVDQIYFTLRDKYASCLREDFCGTAATSCEWIRRSEEKQAISVDMDSEVLTWGQNNNLAELSASQASRISLVQADVMEVQTAPQDIVLAMNFSYFILMTREAMCRYFKKVHQTLRADGVFFLDAFGGYEAAKELTEERDCDGFTYIWEQASFNPINSQMQCYIHFITQQGKRLDKAFSYYWRLWTLPEIQEMLIDSGFKSVDVYWEGTDEVTGEGDGVYQKAKVGTADAGWICYIVAEK